MKRISRVISLRTAVALTWMLIAIAFILGRDRGFLRPPGPTFAEARVLAADGETAAAITIVDELLVTDPANVGNWTFKGYLELELGRVPDAVASFSTAVELRPDGTEALLGLASAQKARGAAPEALASLERLDTDRLVPQQLRRRSQIYGLLGSYEAALVDLDRLLEVTPKSAELLDEASTLAIALNDWERAAELAGRLRSVAPTDDLCRVADERLAFAQRMSRERDVQLAYAADTSGDTASAEELYRDLVREQPDDPLHAVRLGWLLNESGRHQEAWEVLKSLPSNGGADTELLDLRARTAYWAGAFEDAADLLTELADARPQDAQVHLMLADTYRHLGDANASRQARRAYVNLRPDDLQAMRDLGDEAASSGLVDEAIRWYEVIAAERPDSASLARLALLYETSGDLAHAIPLYLRAVDAGAQDDPNLFLRLARLYRWTGRPALSVTWYERYVASAPPSGDLNRARAGLALALLEAKRPEESLSVARAGLADRPDAGLYEAAARAATAVGEWALSVSYLEGLADERPLTRAERTWLAGQYRLAGLPTRSLEIYEALAAPPEVADRAVLEAIGDLRMDAGEHERALTAYERIAGASEDDPLRLKIARGAAAAGSNGVATSAYDDYLAAHPQDIDAHLEAARFFAASRQADHATGRYETVLAARGADGLRLELARNFTAAGRYSEAESWAREAYATGESDKQARVALAISLHLQGRDDEATELLDELAPLYPEDAVLLYWRGLVAIAADRNLQGFLYLGDAIELSAPEQGQAWLFRGDAARNRGDYARAAQSYQQAAASGASRTEVAAAGEELRRRTAPAVEVPPHYSSDSNDLRLFQAGLAAQAWPKQRGRLMVRWLRGFVEQGDARYDRTVADVSFAGLYATPALELAGAIGGEDYSGDGGSLTTGEITGRFHFPGRSLVGFEAAHFSLLSTNDRPEPRQYNRIVDLKAVSPDFTVTRLRGFADWVTVGRHGLWGEAGTDGYEDGNRRWFTYAHYQIPLATEERRWTVVRPNFYVETFRDQVPSYFSPSAHLSAGLMVHTIRDHPGWVLELEVNPQLVRSDGDNGFAAHALVDLSRRLGRVLFGGGAFAFYDRRRDYLKWNLFGSIAIELGG